MSDAVGAHAVREFPPALRADGAHDVDGAHGADGAERLNVGDYLTRAAERCPTRVAVVEPRARLPFCSQRWRRTTFAELELASVGFAREFAARGLARGDRAALFVPPGAELVAVAFALFKLGAVPVLLDPGMGRESLVRALAHVRPRAFIGVRLAQVLRALHARRLASIELAITVRRGRRAASARAAGAKAPAFAVAATRADDQAAILFTSGSTGPPKGVVYTHATFAAEIDALRAMYALAPGEVDLACFPLFALFDAALEMTAVFPPMDASRPARCDPARIAAAIAAHSPTNAFGSPAIWKRVLAHCAPRGERLPSLKRILIAGAPVEPELIAGLRALLDPHADVHTPYGATECLPVSTISGEEIVEGLAELAALGAGTCVGRAAPGVDVALIEITDAPIARWSGELQVGAGALGEICVRGPVVTREYQFDPEHTALAKIADGHRIWHRTGDVGYFDEQGRLWFCGRKSHRLETQDGLVLPVPAENVANRHPAVARTAIVGVGARGRERAALIVEPRAGRVPRDRDERARIASELRALLRPRRARARVPALPAIELVLFHGGFPVDARHNAKIQREKLKAWAERIVADRAR